MCQQRHQFVVELQSFHQIPPSDWKTLFLVIRNISESIHDLAPYWVHNEYSDIAYAYSLL